MNIKETELRKLSKEYKEITETELLKNIKDLLPYVNLYYELERIYRLRDFSFKNKMNIIFEVKTFKELFKESV